MLEGLEISIIQKSEAFDSFFNARIDPEFFLKYYTRMYKKILSKKHELLGDIAFVTDGEHGNAVTTEAGHSKYYGARNVLSGILSDNDVEYISEVHHNKLRKSALIPRDVLVSCVGANIGFAAIVPDDIGVANIVRNVALIRSHQDIFLNEYLQAYLSSSYGKNLYIRMNTGNAQPLVSLDYIKTVPVFKLDLDMQKRIRDLTNLSLEALNKSKSLYFQAEQVLLETVGLADFKPSIQNTNIKTFAQSFGSSGRLDAEYYQPKYEDYISLIVKYKDSWAKLTDVCAIKDTNFNPINEINYQYIELSDIDKSGGITGCTNDFGENLPSRARRFVNAGDVVVSSIEGSLSSCALVPTEYNNALCSTGFYVIKSNEINSETLLVLMKSELMQNILKQSCSGTILTAMNKDEFSNIPIPKIDLTTQANVSQLVQRSFSLKAQSEHLLSIAKRAVEIAIEQDEAAAMAFITKSL